MMHRPLRAVVVFTVVLVSLSGAVFWLQQTLYDREPTLDLTPGAARRVAAVPVAAPVETSDEAPGPAGAAVPVVDEGWLADTSQASGVPVTALRAYARAELMSPRGCGVGWTTLAGIGWIESQHGLIGGRTLGADGVSSSRILGPALNGVGNVMAIPATAQSRRWHGDRVWDHAFGPMQFISGTWVSWEADGDGDGVADPNDVDDAAYAAARYLCAGERDLTASSDWTAAVLSYNNSRDYLLDVHTAATEYGDRTG